MNTMKLSSRSKLSGQGLVLILIVLAILVGLWWYLHATKAATEKDAVRYGHDVINRLVINHDRAILDNDLAPQAKNEMPPSSRDYLIQSLSQYGSPAQPIQIEDAISFDPVLGGIISTNPHGIFTAHLNYPAQAMTMQLAISQGTTKWLIENITVSKGNQAQ